VRSAILALLAEEPMHGYQMIQEIGRRSGGSWKPSPGSVYPTLQQLEDEGLVRADELDGRRIFRLTDEGERLVADRAEEFADLWQGVAPSENDTQLGELVFQVASAFVHVAKTGSPEQLAEARKVLGRTKSDLYRILGADVTGDSVPDDDTDDEGEQDDNEYMKGEPR
jgi:DNA-binding PadR family transcriptional regulator